MSTSLTTRNLVLAALAACEEKKALHARILELDPAESAFTDVFLICSGANPRQVQAIADAVELGLKREFGVYAHSVEGYRTAKWVLLDYVDFVVHVFDEETRALYDIERLRKTASAVTPEDWTRPLVAKVAAVRSGAGAKPAAKKKPAVKKKSGAKGEAKGKTAAAKKSSKSAKKTAAKRAGGRAGQSARTGAARKKTASPGKKTSAAARAGSRAKKAQRPAKQAGKRNPVKKR